jgi:hypothetical protein
MHTPPARRRRVSELATGRTGGAEGNERLTAMTGTVLLGLLAAEGFTILSLGQMLLAASLFAGLVIAALTVHLATPWHLE